MVLNQSAWFTAQVYFISRVYLWETLRLIRLIRSDDKWRRKILYQQLAINVLAIVMDLAVVILRYLNYYFSLVILKATLYNVELKMECAVLGMLVSTVHSRGSEGTFWRVDETTHMCKEGKASEIISFRGNRFCEMGRSVAPGTEIAGWQSLVVLLFAGLAWNACPRCNSIDRIIIGVKLVAIMLVVS